MTCTHFATALVIAAVSGHTAAQMHTHDPLTPTELVYSCWADEAGNLTGGIFELPIGVGPLPTTPPSNVVSLTPRGQIGDLVDLVFVGDGYLESELGIYAADVDRFVAKLWATEPFTTYQNYFRISRVDVISNESGVDGDPLSTTTKDTAMDMGFWCAGIERLLCVDTAKAKSFARQSGPVDHVIAVANSSKYGGAGYSGANLATTSGQNFWSPDVAIHELGHSLGDLADEYFYTNDTYTGSEPKSRNVSIMTEPVMLTSGEKWARWLGETDPNLDGLHSTYEGAAYHQYGIYRPTIDSMMRSLNRPFNGPSMEGLILGIYRYANPIADATLVDAPLSSTSSVWVTPMQPIGHDLKITWTIDGLARPTLDGQAVIDLASLGLDYLTHEVVVTVWDPTDWVRDEAARALRMTASRSWVVNACASMVNFNGDGVLDFFDVQIFLVAFAAGDPSADLTGDGVVDIFDVGEFLELYAAGCL